MRAVQLFLGLWWLSFACAGVLKGPEELSLEAAVENAELEDYAANALLTDEERKIVALLERIENKFGTLDDSDKEEFVKKISNYQDRFASTLAKVETIPGMYGLDVPMLRANLGIHGEDTLEEIHVEYDGSILDATVEDATVEDAPVEDAPAVAETIEPDAFSLARGAADPLGYFSAPAPTPVSVEAPKSKRTIDDVYKVVTQLVQLMLVQIVQQQNEPEPEPVIFYQPPRSYQPSYQYQVQTSPRPRVSARPRQQATAYKNAGKIAMPAYNSGPDVRKVPFNQELAGLLNAIPPVYDDVSMNFNFPKKLRRRRSVVGDAPPVAEVKEDVHDEVHHEDGHGDLQSADAYADWYNTQYLPWYQHYTHQMELYQQAMIAYEAAQLRSLVPTNPFGDVAFGNPFPFYSKTNYMQSLHTDVAGLDPQATYREPYNKWACERESAVEVEGDKCWEPSTPTEPGFCGILDEHGDCVPDVQ